MNKRAWDRHPVGVEVGGAVIREQIADGRHQTEVEYLVEWRCCGRLGTQTHAQLSRRVRSERTICWHCARKLQGTAVGLANHKEVDSGVSPVEVGHIIEIPLPGISGRWSNFGELGPR